jgi:hypothetical protein
MCTNKEREVMSFDTLEYLMEVHYWALLELYVFAAIVYGTKKWIDSYFENKGKKPWKD